MTIQENLPVYKVTLLAPSNFDMSKIKTFMLAQAIRPTNLYAGWKYINITCLDKLPNNHVLIPVQLLYINPRYSILAKKL